MDKIRAFIKDNRDVFLCYIGSKILFIVVLLLTGTSYSDVLGLFDAAHYRDIASGGYYVDGVTVFFPMIPLIMRFTGEAGLIIINQAAFIAGIYNLKKILMRVKDSETVWILAILSVSPMAVFTSVLYTESVYFFLTVFAFRLFIEGRLPLVQGIAIGLSVLTRNTGSLLFFAVFTGYILKFIKEKQSRKRTLTDIIMCYVPASVISLIYPVFLQIRFGNWKIFMDAQYTYWIRIPSNIVRTVFISLKVIFTDEYGFDGMPDTIILFKINEALSLLFMILVIVLIIREIIRMRRIGKISVPSIVCIVYSILFIIALGMTIRDPALDCPTDSFYRYYVSLFPLYLGFSHTGKKTCQAALIVSLLLTLMTAPLFCMGSFFF